MAFIPTADLIAKPILNYVWDPGLMMWVPETQPGGSGGGGTSSTFGAAFPATGTAAGARDTFGNMAALNLDASGALIVSGSSGGGAVTIANGADVVEGSLADAAVITDAAGTISGKLRGLVKWAFERMPASLGQKLMAASFPVVIASDQSVIPVSGTVVTTPPANASTNLTQVGGAAVTLGQKVMAASIPVVIASDQSPYAITVKDFNSGANLGVDGNGQARTRIFDSDGNDVAVASGYADSNIPRGFMVLNDDGTNLHSLKADTDGTTQVDLTKVGGAALTEGQKTMANSVPVVLASDQAAIPVTGPLTDAQLRATPVPVSGVILAANIAVAANTASPLTEGQVALLTQNLNGELRVTDDVQPSILDILKSILVEMRVQSVVLHTTLNCRDDLDQLRTDDSLS